MPYPPQGSGSQLDAEDVWTYASRILTNLSNTRAAYIDNLAHLFGKNTFWSDITDLMTLNNVASDENFPDIVLPNIPGTLTRAYLVLTLSEAVDTSGAQNAVDGAQTIRIKKSTGAWGVDDIAAIDVPDNSLLTATNETRAGVAWIGDIELSSVVDVFNATYNVRWENSLVDGADLLLRDIQIGLIVEWQ